MKKKLFVGLAIVMFFTVGTVLNANAFTFYDDFEAPSLDPFWTVINQDLGMVSLSSDLAHSGTQSARFDHYSTSGQKDIRIGHIFPEVINGEVSVWFYDTVMSHSYSYLTLFNSTSLFALGIMDFDNYPGNFWYHSSDSNGRTSIQRTPGWHEFRVNFGATGGELYIDDLMVNSFTGAHGFDSVYLSTTGPRSASTTYYYDDFSITPSTPAPEPATMLLLGTGLVGMAGVMRRKTKK